MGRSLALGTSRHRHDPALKEIQNTEMEEIAKSDLSRRRLVCPSRNWGTATLVVTKALICERKGKGTGHHAYDDGEGNAVLPMHPEGFLFSAVVLHGYDVRSGLGG